MAEATVVSFTVYKACFSNAKFERKKISLTSAHIAERINVKTDVMSPEAPGYKAPLKKIKSFFKLKLSILKWLVWLQAATTLSIVKQR